jgi:hypothetical protein
MTWSRCALQAIVLVATACGGAVSGDGSGGGGVSAGGTGGTASVGGAGNGTGGSTDMGGSTGTGGTAGTTATGGMAGTTSVDAATCGVIRASDYNQSCKADSDCVRVFSGDTCVACPCPNSTINKNAAAGYHPLIPVGGPACACPMPGIPTCVSGVCTICPPAGCPVKDSGTTSVDAAVCGVIRASDYDQSCKVATDCVLVVEGDTCSGGCSNCQNATINRVAAAAYHPNFKGLICPCPAPPMPSCVAGVCTACPFYGCPVGDGGVAGSGGSGGGMLDAAHDALPKNCIDAFGGGQPAVCCPEPAPDCTGKPDGYPGYFCVSKENQFCSCQCQGGTWTCAC